MDGAITNSHHKENGKSNDASANAAAIFSGGREGEDLFPMINARVDIHTGCLHTIIISVSGPNISRLRSITHIILHCLRFSSHTHTCRRLPHHFFYYFHCQIPVMCFFFFPYCLPWTLFLRYSFPFFSPPLNSVFLMELPWLNRLGLLT